MAKVVKPHVYVGRLKAFKNQSKALKGFRSPFKGLEKAFERRFKTCLQPSNGLQKAFLTIQKYIFPNQMTTTLFMFRVTICYWICSWIPSGISFVGGGRVSAGGQGRSLQPQGCSCARRDGFASSLG